MATAHPGNLGLKDGPTRGKQLDRIFELAGKDGDAIVLGDLNFGDGEQPETGRLDRSYADMWLRLRPGRAGYTWDIHKNPLAKANSFATETSRRLDRILVRSAHWQPASIQILGDAALKAIPSGRIFPSDHFGLLGELSWKSARSTRAGGPG